MRAWQERGSPSTTASLIQARLKAPSRVSCQDSPAAAAGLRGGRHHHRHRRPADRLHASRSMTSSPSTGRRARTSRAISVLRGGTPLRSPRRSTSVDPAQQSQLLAWHWARGCPSRLSWPGGSRPARSRGRRHGDRELAHPDRDRRARPGSPAPAPRWQAGDGLQQSMAAVLDHRTAAV